MHCETIWKASLGTGMGRPSYKPRKEPYDYVEQPHKNTLKTFPLPKRVLAAKYESGFGSSRITPRGIEQRFKMNREAHTTIFISDTERFLP